MKLRSFLGVILTVLLLSIGLVSISGCSTTVTQTSSVIQPTSETPVVQPAPVVMAVTTPAMVVTTVTTPATVVMTVTIPAPVVTTVTIPAPVVTTVTTPAQVVTTVTTPAQVVMAVTTPAPVVTPVTTPTPTPASITTPVQFSLYSPLTAQQVYPLIQSNPNIIIIDARATGEYTGAVTAGVSVGHLPGAYSVPDDGSAAQQLYKFPDKTLPYICYCDDAACAHGSNVASIMAAAGYTNVTYMSDGIAGWTAQGYSLVTGG
jgi:rhodanese-related sulfurtransferase